MKFSMLLIGIAITAVAIIANGNYRTGASPVKAPEAEAAAPGGTGGADSCAGPCSCKAARCYRETDCTKLPGFGYMCPPQDQCKGHDDCIRYSNASSGVQHCYTKTACDSHPAGGLSIFIY